MAPNRPIQFAIALTVAFGLSAPPRPAAAGPMYSATRLSPGWTEPASVDSVDPDDSPLGWVVDHPTYGEEPAVFKTAFPATEPTAAVEPWHGPEPPRLVTVAHPEGTPAGKTPELATSGVIDPAAMLVAPPPAAPVGNAEQVAGQPPKPIATPSEDQTPHTLATVEDRTARQQDSLDPTVNPVTDGGTVEPIASASTTASAPDSPESATPSSPPTQIARTTTSTAPAGAPDTSALAVSVTHDRSTAAVLPTDKSDVSQDATILDAPTTSHGTTSAGDGATWDRPSYNDGKIVGESVVHAISGTDLVLASATEDGKALDLNGLLKSAMGVELARASAISDAGRILAEPEFRTSWDAVGGNPESSGPPAITTITPPSPPLTTPEPATWILFAALCLPLLHRARRAAASRPVTR